MQTTDTNCAIAPQLLMRCWSVDEYHSIITLGLFAADERFELLEGWIVRRKVQGPRSSVVLSLMTDVLARALPMDWRVRVRSAITTSDSEPEPDLAVVRGPADRYLQSHPTAPDIALVVEIAERSLQDDRRDKARVYARAGIAIYWIVNLVDRQAEVHANPSGNVSSPSYAAPRVFGENESVPLVIDGKSIGSVAVRDLLP
jgi:Uma2 family endonuclease